MSAKISQLLSRIIPDIEDLFIVENVAEDLNYKVRFEDLQASILGDQTVTLTGDVTGSGIGTIPVTLNTVTVDKGGTGLVTIPAGNLLVGNDTGAVITNPNLYWDNTNSRLGIGTSTPSVPLEVKQTQDASLGVELISSATNRTFTGSIGNWVSDGSFTYSANRLNAVSGIAGSVYLPINYLSQAPIAGESYQLSFTLNLSAGTIYASFGGTLGQTIRSFSGAPTIYQVITATDSIGPLTFTADDFASGYVDNISLKKLTPSLPSYKGMSFSGSDYLEVRSLFNGIAIGKDAGKFIAGGSNVALGPSAGKSISSGSSNICIGSNAGSSMVTVSGNVCIGSSAGSGIITSSNNLILGTSAGSNLQTGSGGNVLLGYNSGFNLSNASSNMLLGSSSGFNITKAVNVTAIGTAAGYHHTTGNYCTYVGSASNTTDGTIQYSTAIGYGAFLSVSGEIVLGNANVFVLRPGSDSAVSLGTATNRFSRIFLGTTDTPTGTTGSVTINKATGSVNVAPLTTSLVVTNSLVTPNTKIFATVATNDATCVIKSIVAASGSFAINYEAPTAETRLNFFIVNVD